VCVRFSAVHHSCCLPPTRAAPDPSPEARAFKRNHLLWLLHRLVTTHNPPVARSLLINEFTLHLKTSPRCTQQAAGSQVLQHTASHTLRLSAWQPGSWCPQFGPPQGQLARLAASIRSCMPGCSAQAGLSALSSPLQHILTDPCTRRRPRCCAH
jgi:hypothetical protein